MPFWRVLREQPLLGIFVATIAAGSIVGTTCFGVGLLLAVPMLAVLVRRMLGSAERLADDAPGRQLDGPLFAPGVTAFACVAAVVAGALAAGLGVGIGLNEALSRLPSWGYAAAIAASIAGAALVGAVGAPLAYVPFAASDRELRLGAAIGRGLEVARCDSPASLAWMGARAAMALVAPPVLLGSLELVEKDWGAAALFALGPSLWIATAVVASRYVVARRLAPPKDAARRMPPVVVSATFVSAVVVAAIAGVTTWAALTPSEASVRHASTEDAPHEASMLALSATEDATIPGTFVRLRAARDGLFVSTPDGGGAGRIVCGVWPVSTRAAWVTVRPAAIELEWPDGLVAPETRDDRTDGLRCRATLTRGGVRLDDGLDRRVLVSGGFLYILGVLVAIMGLVTLALGAVRCGLDARVLTAADPSSDRAAGGLLAIEGNVHASTIESNDGAFRFRLRRALQEGTQVTVVARFAGLTAGLRDVPRELPRGARVLAGGLEDARRVVAARASRYAAYGAAFVIGGGTLAVVTLARAVLARM